MGNTMELTKIKDMIKQMATTHKVEGSSVFEGHTYGRLPFKELENMPYHRDNKERTDWILNNMPENCKSILDLGCNVGHLSFELASHGFKVYGIDYDGNAINIAKKINEYYHMDCEFYAKNILDISLMYQKYDVILFLSAFQWIVKQIGIFKAKMFINILSDRCKYMFFETSGSDSMAQLIQADDFEWQKDLLETHRFKILDYKKMKVDTGNERWIIKCLSI